MYIRFVRSAGRRLALLLGLTSLLYAHAQAQGVADPFRPPALGAAQGQATGAPVLAEPLAPVAHIVISGPARKFAVVDGNAVRVGETYNGFRLVAISQDGLVWQKGGTREKTSMSPGVEKSQPGAKARKAATPSNPIPIKQ